MPGAQTDTLYPPSAFYFKVMFGGTHENTDTSFQEVSGIVSEMEIETVVEGGENRFVHQLPKGIKHPNLELKRGIAPKDSPLVKWCIAVMEGDFVSAIETQAIRVFLMNENKTPIRGWLFDSAYPVKWEIESFGSTKNEVAIEKIVLNYNYSKRIV
ncbi:phage tail protein [Nitrosomonas sp.]|uniref:phage tail protein n=1 Tax=Nitrosomonas sp. TaxID=42353 RepID=UPI001DD86490|nr:phage tail protein [Nitrosomonas sp.]MCB1947904.1 phage tail protein [Nitrosomonas sp.]MCP5243661.1 phage tail protein [Burkholderiales bacterium]MDR4515338.1 phage tail protein [Nitrosomonas sp.]